MKIARQLVVLNAGLVALVSVVLTWLVYVNTSQSAMREVMDRFKERAGNRMLAVDAMLHDHIRDVEVIAGDAIFCGTDPSAQKITFRLTTYRNLMKIYLSLSYTSAEGIRLADTAGQGIGLVEDPRNPIAKRWPQLISGQLNHSVGYSRLLNDDLMFFTYPVKCPGDTKPRGIVIARVNLWRLHALFPVANSGDFSFPIRVVLYDDDGMVLYSNHHRSGTVRPRADQDRAPAGDKGPSQEQSSRESKKNDGELLSYSAHGTGTMDFKGSNWLLQLSVTREAVLAPVRELLWRLLALAVLGSAMSALLTSIYARRLVQPLPALLDTIQSIEKDHLDHLLPEVEKVQRTSVAASVIDNELRQLTQSLDHLALGLASWTRHQSAADGHPNLARKIDRNIIDSSHRGILVFLVEDGQCVRANPAVQKLFRLWSNTDSLHINFRQPDTCPGPEALWNGVRKSVASGIDAEWELSLASQPDQELWWHVASTYFSTPEGKYLSLSISDISPRKQGEEAMARAREMAEHANRGQGEFLARMRHEIRPPMNAVIGLGHLALRMDMSAELRDHLEKIITSSQSLLQIIDDSLDFSRIETGGPKLEPDYFHLRDVFERLVEMFRYQLSEKHLEWVLSLAEICRLEVYGHPLHLEQILINLVGHAIRLTDSGEIETQVKIIRETVDSVTLEFIIRDTGRGLSREQMDHLLRPLTPTGDGTARTNGGTGLGLSLCRKLIGLLGGWFWVDSQPGEGSRFHFTAIFPRRPPPDETRDLLLPEDMHLMTVLIVDDNVAVSRSLLETIQGFGLAGKAVDSASEAVAAVVAAVESGRPMQLVLMDGMMPEINGIEVVNRIRAALAAEDLPKFILMQPSGGDNAALATDARFDAMVVKPVHCSSLFDSIMGIWGRQVTHEPHANKDSLDLAAVAERLKGARVLVVEDNVINQQVAEGILGAIGLMVEMAWDGEEAIERIRRQTDGAFDAVLMDIQMPGMGGLEAARTIRREFPDRPLPIIAMSAHALEGDRRLCLDAGMNDHVAKPIVRSVLFSKLIEWIGRKDARGGLSESVSVPTPSVAEAAQGWTIAGLDLDQALHRLDGDERLLFSVLNELVRNYKDFPRELSRLLAGNEAGDREKATAMAHAVRGVAGNLSAQRLFAAAASLEQALRDQALDLAPWLAEFDVALTELVTAIENRPELSEDPGLPANPGPSPARDWPGLLALVHELGRQIDAHHFDTDELCARVTPLLLAEGDEPFRALVERMRDQIDRVEFEEARQSFDAVMQVLLATKGRESNGRK
ncbi:MAG: response regulator [Magnetococcales bacterium]|nr:response regulator [Magnetococcales bacterium]